MNQDETEIDDKTSNKAHISYDLVIKNKKLASLVIVAFFFLLGVILIYIFTRNNNEESTKNNTADTTISSFEECVEAGNPVLETYPEQCVANGQTFVRSLDDNSNNTTNSNSNNNTDTTEEDKKTLCKTGEVLFSNENFGAHFCYPKEWGTASVMDAKIDTIDTGYREAVRFSANAKFIMGGVSDNWTTTVGRDIGCQEPSNALLELSSYNTEWNNIIGSGMDIEFAQRSLPTSVGGYDMEETVSNVLNSGVCAQGHKVINGSRYRVISAAFYNDFSTASSILTPKAHIDNPFILFTTLEREQLDRLLASAVMY